MRPSKKASPAESRPRLAGQLSSAALVPVWILLAFTLACSVHDAERASGNPGRDAASAGARLPTPGVPERVLATEGDARSNGNYTAADSLLATPEVYAGWRSFNVNCQTCHGFNAVGSDVAPDLRNSVGEGGSMTHAAFKEVVRKGRMDKGMPAWGALLDGVQIDQIYAYLVARSSGSLGAGQPHIAGN